MNDMNNYFKSAAQRITSEDCAMKCLDQMLPPVGTEAKDITCITIILKGMFKMIEPGSTDIEDRNIFKVQSSYIVHDESTGGVSFKSCPDPIEIASSKSIDELADLIIKKFDLEKTHTVLRTPEREGHPKWLVLVNFKTIEKYIDYFEIRISQDEYIIPVFSFKCVFASVWFNLPIFLDLENYFDCFPDFLLKKYFDFLRELKEQELYAKRLFDNFYNGLSQSLKLLYEGNGL